MYNICIFAGTTEGRRLAEFLSSQPVRVTACVATEYGETLLPNAENFKVLAGRMPVDDIKKMLEETPFDLVIDATHPYAASITESISSACLAAGTEYLRLLRKASDLKGVYGGEIVYADNADSAVEFLNGTDGNIFLTTGSKEISKYSKINDFSERVYARVLPAEASLRACADAGLGAAHIIAMQGPFSEEMNIAMMKAVSAAWVVTKDGGAAGGFGAKISAAEKAGARTVVIGRPPQRDGVSFEETIEQLCSRFGCVRTPNVNIIGIGPGSRSVMTQEARRAVENADCVIGAARMVEAAAVLGQNIYEAIDPARIAEYIMSGSKYGNYAVVMSGDAGFFSGTKKLLPLLGGCEVKILPGISSLAYFCAKLKISYEDIKVVSLHGREHDIAEEVRKNNHVFVLTGGSDGINRLCRTLVDAGLGDVSVSVGERLSYTDENIARGSARQLAEGIYHSLSVALIENKYFKESKYSDDIITHGLPDDDFQRGSGENGVVPMTKSEVRTVCLSKMRLTERSLCWDIGAGTGSVSVEMALQAKKGRVYAVERREDAAALLRSNKSAFSVENLEIIKGIAPDACRTLPAPTHVFIGGSSGNMKEIINIILEKNSLARIVATAVSLETVAELTECIKIFGFEQTEIVSIQVARSKKAGAYNLMNAQNPVYIFTMQAGGLEK